MLILRLCWMWLRILCALPLVAVALLLYAPVAVWEDEIARRQWG